MSTRPRPYAPFTPLQRRRVLPWTTLFGLSILLALAPSLAHAQVTAGRPYRDHYFDSGGVRLRYVDVGRGEPVVLIHGYTMDVERSWIDWPRLRAAWPGFVERRPFLPALARRYRVIALDSRGHGQSGKPHDPDAYGLEMVRDVVRLLDHLHIRRAHLIGYSDGADIAMKLMVTYPGRCRTVVLGGSGGIQEGAGFWRTRTEMARTGAALAESLEHGRGMAPLLRHDTRPGEAPPSPTLIAQCDALFLAGQDARALAQVARHWPAWSVTEAQVRANTVPTLAIVGTKDSARVDVARLRTVMPHLEVVYVPGAQHMQVPNRPEFLRAIEGFLDRHGGRE